MAWAAVTGCCVMRRDAAVEGAMVAVYVVERHGENIKRLRMGTEPRIGGGK